ncbi:cytochrome c oxidase subunit 5A, mitochondrial-like [Clavelina lepadiformis]|uniref:cytochrome c oxidase subunit 5A, mitochondrial-like n=1 Tax=Clavelina lepadiformis TaxID=159417 RepID=UPI00404203F4
MFRSIFRLAQTSSRAIQVAAGKNQARVSAVTAPAVRKYSSVTVYPSDEEQDAAWVSYFENKDMDTYDFILGFMQIYREDLIPEPKIIQSALYACRRLDNLPLAMRVLEMVKNKCGPRKDIYDYLMQELKPTFDDLGLKTVEDYGLDQVAD